MGSFFWGSSCICFRGAHCEGSKHMLTSFNTLWDKTQGITWDQHSLSEMYIGCNSPYITHNNPYLGKCLSYNNCYFWELVQVHVHIVKFKYMFCLPWTLCKSLLHNFWTGIKHLLYTAACHSGGFFLFYFFVSCIFPPCKSKILNACVCTRNAAKVAFLMKNHWCVELL